MLLLLLLLRGLRGLTGLLDGLPCVACVACLHCLRCFGCVACVACLACLAYSLACSFARLLTCCLQSCGSLACLLACLLHIESELSKITAQKQPNFVLLCSALLCTVQGLHGFTLVYIYILKGFAPCRRPLSMTRGFDDCLSCLVAC